MHWLGDFFSFDVFRGILIAAVPALICITVHELSHGYVAYRLGDNTAKKMGRLTLNPIKHIDIVGLAMIVLIGFGWAKPVPVDMRNFRHPKWGMALTALAGPASNLLLAIVVAFIFMLIPPPYGGIGSFAMAVSPYSGQLPVVTLVVYRLLLINVYLAVFNLLPIPPLDGSKILFALLPENTYYKLMRYERFGMILLLVLIFSGRFLSFDVFSLLVGRPAMSLLINIAELAYNVAG